MRAVVQWIEVVTSEIFQTLQRGTVSLGDPSKRGELVTRVTEELTRKADKRLAGTMQALDHIVVDRPVAHRPLIVAHQVAENLCVNHNDQEQASLDKVEQVLFVTNAGDERHIGRPGAIVLAVIEKKHGVRLADELRGNRIDVGLSISINGCVSDAGLWLNDVLPVTLRVCNAVVERLKVIPRGYVQFDPLRRSLASTEFGCNRSRSRRSE